ncbi:MAG TPA: Hpt domain-containing protein [Caulobacteraceae bacterium]|nr:Hpt domain-containing protein [Caulobacteraceae bacterium]
MSDFDARYQDLRRRFVARSLADLPILEQAVQGLEPVHPETLRMTVHRMAGAAGTFGYRELSDLAGEVDDRLMESDTPPAERLRALIAMVRSLDEA